MKLLKCLAVLPLALFLMAITPQPGWSAATDPNPFTSSVSMDKTTIESDNIDSVKYTVRVCDQNYNPVQSVPVYFASSRGSTDTFFPVDPWRIYDVGENVQYCLTDSEGVVEVRLQSRVNGEASVGFALKNTPGGATVYKYLVRAGVTTADIDLITNMTATVGTTVQDTQQTSLYEVKLKNRTSGNSFSPQTKSDNQGLYYLPTADGGTTWGIANGQDYYEVAVLVTNLQNSPQANQVVEFNLEGTGASLDQSRVTTDAKGTARVKVSARQAGLYTLKYHTINSAGGQVRVSFGELPQVWGSKAVSMVIGSTIYQADGKSRVTDLAPFIKDNRTFVAVRPAAEAFGAAINWNESSRTVTLTRPDITVVIAVGSQTIIVVKDGATTAFLADVPPFIQGNRTVLPIRAVGEAFGATVNYDAVARVVCFTQ